MINPLVTDRTPLVLIERSKVLTKGSSVVAEKSGNVINLPIRDIHLIVLGNGTSITSEAMYLCAKNNCFIAQSKGGVSVHSVLHGGLYPNPKKIVRQAALSVNPEYKLKAAKYIVSEKIKGFITFETKMLNMISSCISVDQVLGVEGALTKKEYKNNYGNSFKREYKTSGILNKNINILNSVFYSFVSTIIVTLGYSPSVGFAHGHTRRGGFTFDIVDMFKHSLYLSNTELLHYEGNITRRLSNLLFKDKLNVVHNIIRQTEIICGGDL